VITVICFGVMLGLLSYECVASEVEVIFSKCTLPSAIRLEWIQVQTTSAVDAFSDALSTQPLTLLLIRFQNSILT